MKKVKKTALKRMVSLVLSVMLLAGIIYIPRVSNSDALAGLPDGYANLTEIGELKSSEFGRCRAVKSNYAGGMLVVAGSPLATAGYKGVAHDVIDLYWDLRTGNNKAAIYCIEPSADYLPTESGEQHDSNIFVDSPVGKVEDRWSNPDVNKVDYIELEQTKLLSYALALGQLTYPNGVYKQLTDELNSTNYIIDPNVTYENTPENIIEFVRGAATQLIIWSITQQWYKDEATIESIYNYLQNYPNIKTAMQNIWVAIWDAMKADEEIALSGVSYDPNNKNANTYIMEWDPVLKNYKTKTNEIQVGNNLSNYRIKNIDNITFETQNDKIIITGDPGTGGVIVELSYNENLSRYRAVVGYIISKRSEPRDQSLVTCIELYDACAFSDSRAYFKVVRPEETTALIQKKIDENDTRGILSGGFKFNIWHYDSGVKGAQLEGPNSDKSFTTNSDGQILLKETSAENLTAGDYWVEEIEQPNPLLPGCTNGFKLIKAKFTVEKKSYNINVTPPVNYFEFKNEIIKIEFEKKLDERVNDTLDGFSFDIYEYDPTDARNDPDKGGVPGNVYGKRVAYVVTDEDGIAKVNKDDPLDVTPGNQTDDLNGEILPAGNYWIVEKLTRKSARYYLISEVFEITNDSGEQHFVLLNELIQIKPVKEVERDADTPDDFVFDIYEYDEENDGPKGEPIITGVVSDEDGKIELDSKKLPPGRYWVRERLTEKSKKYYLIDEEIEIVNNKDDIKNKDGEDDTIQYFPLKNELRKVTMEKTMSDNPSRTRDISGIKFRIFPMKFKDDYKAGKIRWAEILTGRNEDPDNKYFAEEFGINEKGDYTLEGIPEGHYWIEELPNDKNSGYYLIDEEITICESGFYIDDGELKEFENPKKIDGITEKDGNKYIIKPLENKLKPPPVTEPTKPTTTTTEPTTNTTNPTTTTTPTTNTTEKETTTQSSTEPTIESSTESSTEPTIEPSNEPTTKVPLSSGLFGEYNTDEDSWYVYDENDTPLVIVKIPTDENIEDFDLGNWIPPKANIPSPSEERENPKTGDNTLTIPAMVGLIGLSAAGILILRRRHKNK